ncbi:hypothetical protein [Rouxiella badensis]|nr:hypothetical protein [Rouxiella badensis]
MSADCAVGNTSGSLSPNDGRDNTDAASGLVSTATACSPVLMA